jgi:hypothetical protein
LFPRFFSILLVEEESTDYSKRWKRSLAPSQKCETRQQALQGWHRFNCSAARTLLLMSSCSLIIGSSARAHSPQDPAVVVSAPAAKAVGVDPNAKVIQCTWDRNRREEIDRAIRDRIATLYPNCRQSFEGGRIFDIQMEDIRVQGNSAIVSYVLALFENCEEGAPVYEASRHKEHWIRGAKRWELEEIAPRLSP